MHTSILLVALSAVAPAAMTDSPAWVRDYGQARKQGQEEKKPLAVFFGKGEKGWQRVSRKGRLGRQTKETLADKFVCVYVDTATKEGRKAASRGKIRKGRGLVISDQKRDFQAFRQDGSLSNHEMYKYLKRFSNADRVAKVKKTVVIKRRPAFIYRPARANFFMPGGGGGGGGC